MKLGLFTPQEAHAPQLPDKSSCRSSSLLLRKNPSSAKSIAWTCTCARMAPAISFRNHLRLKGVANRGHLELATK